MMKTTKDVSKHNQSMGLDLNPYIPEYAAVTLRPHVGPQISV
jgi:hypothetical protein